MATVSRLNVSCMVFTLLSACGGGGAGSGTTYQVTATAGIGGTISPANATVNANGTTTATVTASSGYAISSVTGCGGTLSGSTYTTGMITANCTITASFIAQLAVTGTAGAGGAISPTSATVNAGGTTTLTVTPNSGYVIIGVTGCAGALGGTTYTTGAITAACTVTATFAPAFTWVGGSNTPNAPAVYGVQGVAAATNNPGSRDAGVSWTDAGGNLWLFGGFAGYSNALDPTTGNFVNDLWKYSPSNGQWTWVSGSNTFCPQGVYGTQGVAAATNVPGGRSAAIHWTDANGNVWLYGGGGCDSTGAFVNYSDLWKFSSSSWTWIGGTSASYVAPVYGTEGVAATANTPGARNGAATWTDANGNLLMFGGYGFSVSGGVVTGTLNNDLWEYLPASNKWAWIGGPNTVNGKGVYGIQSVPDAANVPGARSGAAYWSDAQGNFWLFGGIGYDATGAQTGLLNDLWKYSPSSGQWTWVGGSNTINSPGVYGASGVAAVGNLPAARASSTTWLDSSGNVWVFGGETYDVPTHFYHRINDLWKYSPSTGEWTWVAGSSTFDATGVYGTRGVAAISNIPGARAAPFKWKDTSGTVWLFGGFQIDDPTNTRYEMNDLWTFPGK